jgi:dihydroneopterin aldolase
VTDRILVRGLIFQGRHGTTAEERAASQPIEVDVALELDLRSAGESDDLDRTVDYATVTRQVRQVVESTSFRLIESIAEAIAAALLATHLRVDAVEVHVHKPRIRLGDGAGAAAVEIHRRRSGGAG